MVNNKVRKDLQSLVNRLKTALDIIEAVSDSVSDICDEQSNIFDNIPENLQGSDRAYRQEEAVEALNEAVDLLSGLPHDIEEAAEKLTAAIEA